MHFSPTVVQGLKWRQAALKCGKISCWSTRGICNKHCCYVFAPGCKYIAFIYSEYESYFINSHQFYFQIKKSYLFLPKKPTCIQNVSRSTSPISWRSPLNAISLVLKDFCFKMTSTYLHAKVRNQLLKLMWIFKLFWMTFWRRDHSMNVSCPVEK